MPSQTLFPRLCVNDCNEQMLLAQGAVIPQMYYGRKKTTLNTVVEKDIQESSWMGPQVEMAHVCLVIIPVTIIPATPGPLGLSRGTTASWLHCNS